MKRSEHVRMILGFYLGFSISWFFNTSLFDWRWWAVVIPIIILEGVMIAEKNKESQ